MDMQTRQTCSRYNKLGITLVELLVVVAITGLIIALLLPAIQAARESARRVQCQSHARQIGLSLLQYLDLNHEFPAAAVMHTLTPDVAPLTEFLAPHAENSEAIFRCPSDFKYFDRGERISYEYNGKLAGNTRAELVQDRPLGETIVLFDFENFHGPRGRAGSRNVLYADGRVGPL
jgi:prepilin-type processing-associated H-X9-DG protein